MKWTACLLVLLWNATCAGVQDHRITPMAPASQLVKEAKTAAPNTPPLLWVVSPNEWNIPPERGGGQDKALATLSEGSGRHTRTQGEHQRFP
jgi:hypothetical protein